MLCFVLSYIAFCECDKRNKIKMFVIEKNLLSINWACGKISLKLNKSNKNVGKNIYNELIATCTYLLTYVHAVKHVQCMRSINKQNNYFI